MAPEVHLYALLPSLMLLPVLLFCCKHRTRHGRLSFPRFQRPWEPTILARIRFIFQAKSIVHDAYVKMKNHPFVISTWSRDVLLLPVKYLEDIRLVPVSRLNVTEASIANLVPRYTSLESLVTSRLHIEVLKQKLSPDLGKHLASANEELDFGWELELCPTNEWSEIVVNDLLQRLVARMTSRVFVGMPTCRNPEWLKLSVDFTIDTFVTAFTLCHVPAWTHPLIARLIPARYRAQRQLRTAERIIRLVAHDRHEADHEERVEPGEDSLLDWMLDHGTPSERDPSEMAARQCAMTLASIHTTVFTIANVMFDLCAHPEWFAVLRQEIDELSRQLGGPSQLPKSSVKDWYSRLEKLDSFLVESQRHNPVMLLIPQRKAISAVTLSDGTAIPEGTVIAFPKLEHQLNSKPVTPCTGPTSFDPMRSYRMRQVPGENQLHRAGMTSPSNLSFGYGNQACPGRHFAIAQIKMIVVRLLKEFEFKFLPGQTRPKVFHIDEFSATNPFAKLLIRQR